MNTAEQQREQDSNYDIKKHAELDKEGEYKSFLKSLDDSQFISHLTSISQSQDANHVLSSTPKTQRVSQVSSDPFDDSFNEILLRKSDHSIVKEAESTNKTSDDLTANLDHQIGPRHEFGEYDVYFKNKQLKQQLNDQEYTEWDRKRREDLGEEVFREPIFKGCIIHVNGHTVPSLNEIHRLVIVHGGKFIGFLNNKSAATHIICERLTPRKQIQFKNYRVVKAKWIVDCIAAKKLLDWRLYRLFKEVDFDQQRLDMKQSTMDFAVGQFNNEDIIDDENELLLENDFGDQINGEIEFSNNRLDPLVDSKKNSIMDAKHPDFLANFFANSRLHHLSSWKSDLKQTFMKRVLEHLRNNPKSKKVANVPRVILHIDFDCFFASASCLKRKDLDIFRDPIVVSHGNNTSDIASCNYVVRKFGIRNGMWMGSAKKLCDKLITLDYEFDLYEKCASDLYNYLLSKADDFDSLIPVLIDEALVDITSYSNDGDASQVELRVYEFCELMRQDILKLTGCTVSIGASSNILLAKLALRKAKPNGFYGLYKDIEKFLDPVPLNDLPGVGRSLVNKFETEFGIPSPTVSNLRDITKARLMNVFGPKTGEKLYDYSRGIDNSLVELDTNTTEALLGRKSVSVDVNFGIRFDLGQQVETFMVEMGKEVSKRLKKLGLVGSQVTLKLAQRTKDSPVNPPKYLGMGKCDFINKTAKLGIPSNEWGVIAAELKSLTRILDVPPSELRGVAVMISKLEDAEQFRKNKQQKLNFGQIKQKRTIKNVDTSEFKDPMEGISTIDWDVFDELPWDIKKELKDEMFRRGMISESSPKKDNGTKVYRQQLLPSGNGHEPRYIRVIESPKKKPKSRTSLPKKGRSITPAVPGDESYDSEVLGELPSSIRDEVVQDLQRRRQLEPVTLKSKFNEIAERSKDVNEPIDVSWLQKQQTLSTSPLFLNSPYSYADMKMMISAWVENSLLQDGPHEGDVDAFADYLHQLCQQNNLPRCLRLINVIKKEVEYHEAICNVIQGELTQQSASQIIALQEWRTVLETKFDDVLRLRKFAV